LDLLTVDLRNAIAFLDPHLLGRRIREDAHDGDAVADTFTDDVHAQASVLIIAAAVLAGLALAVNVGLLLAELAALLPEFTAPLGIAAKLRIAT
jgi:nicotinate-nucleotide pyrophosphorylase